MTRIPFPTSPRAATPLARLRGARKQNGATLALDDIDLDVHAGEVELLGGDPRTPALQRGIGVMLQETSLPDTLRVSQGTVRNHLSEAIGKLAAANRIEAYSTARAKGWL